MKLKCNLLNKCGSLLQKKHTHSYQSKAGKTDKMKKIYISSQQLTHTKESEPKPLSPSLPLQKHGWPHKRRAFDTVERTHTFNYGQVTRWRRGRPTHLEKHLNKDPRLGDRKTQPERLQPPEYVQENMWTPSPCYTGKDKQIRRAGTLDSANQAQRKQASMT